MRNKPFPLEHSLRCFLLFYWEESDKRRVIKCSPKLKECLLLHILTFVPTVKVSSALSAYVCVLGALDPVMTNMTNKIKRWFGCLKVGQTSQSGYHSSYFTVDKSNS